MYFAQLHVGFLMGCKPKWQTVFENTIQWLLMYFSRHINHFNVYIKVQGSLLGKSLGILCAIKYTTAKKKRPNQLGYLVGIWL